MPDPRFYSVQGPYTLAELADACGATVNEGTDPELTIHDVAPLDAASNMTSVFCIMLAMRSNLRVAGQGLASFAPTIAGMRPREWGC